MGIRKADRARFHRCRRWQSPLPWAMANFTPLSAPASNETIPDFTPPFPAYVSGHADFRSGVCSRSLRQLYGSDDMRVHVHVGRVKRRDH